MPRYASSVFVALAITTTVMSASRLVQTRPDAAVTFPPSTPEKQGMDSRVLVRMFDDIEDQNLQIHSVAVLRGDHVVLEAYFHPFQPEYVHRIASSTKSITSALIGIAIDQGLIRDVNQAVLRFFGDHEITNIDTLWDFNDAGVSIRVEEPLGTYRIQGRFQAHGSKK